jgi:hypothetical protein
MTLMPRKSPSRRVPKSSGRNDTLVSASMLSTAVRAILARKKLDRDHDIPYLAGYSRNGKTIYIDRHIPKTFLTRGRRINVAPFLVLHESVEKSLLDELGLHYQHAHQIALRAEEAAVRAAGVSWREYDRFMQRYVKEVYDEKLRLVPVDLDVKPYRDEHDTRVLREMIEDMKRERAFHARSRRRRQSR